ncbi:MAG: hypothetical protein K2U26_17290 [Cyclobacteriaceae bacterium]|nr:hypothetical protein [Cyclobacteriaceae bacterium]
METKNDSLSAQQSLDVITSMIRQAQGNVSRSSFYFLLWGWVIAICNLGMYFMYKLHFYPRYAPYIWLLVLPTYLAMFIYGRKQEKDRIVKTHLDQISKWLWISMAITIAPAWLFGDKLNWMINAVIMMPIGAATFVSGIIIRFKPLLYGGILFWVAGITCYFLPPIDQILAGGIAVVLGYLIPGYMLRNQREKDA